MKRSILFFAACLMLTSLTFASSPWKTITCCHPDNGVEKNIYACSPFHSSLNVYGDAFGRGDYAQLTLQKSYNGAGYGTKRTTTSRQPANTSLMNISVIEQTVPNSFNGPYGVLYKGTVTGDGDVCIWLNWRY